MNPICPRCLGPIPDNAPGAGCPACLMSLGLGNGSEAAGVESFSEKAGILQRLGDYELLEEIGRGGMGVVYRARQCRLDRIVALKLILSGQFASKQEVLRFRAEAEAAANLRHRNIVTVHETGEHNGQHYFSMEYVPGRDLAAIARDGPLAPRLAARYAQRIAEAIHYAHQRGTLHRDLKPSNILIDADDEPRITDFGLAKRAFAAGSSDANAPVTLTAQALGSPGFMPPERTSGKQSKIGAASDVYSIGAILYHLLTGRPPFQGAGVEEIIRQLHEQDPVAPRLLNASIPRDLDTICLKCLEKSPAQRYQAAEELASELGCFLRDEPIRSRPVSRPERIWRWCRRKPVIAGLLVAVNVALLLGAGGVLWQWQRATRAAQALRERVYASDMNLAFRAFTERNFDRGVELVQRHLPTPGEADLRDFKWQYLWALSQGQYLDSVQAHEGIVEGLALLPDGRSLITGGNDHLLKLWDLRDRKNGKVLKTFAHGINSIAQDAADLAHHRIQQHHVNVVMVLPRLFAGNRLQSAASHALQSEGFCAGTSSQLN